MIALIDILGKSMDGDNVRPIANEVLFKLGYSFTDRSLSANSGEGQTVIHEVVDSETKREVSFSFLYSSKEKKGIVLPKPFDHYLGVFSRKVAEERSRSVLKA